MLILGSNNIWKHMVLWDTVLITAKTFGRGIIDYNRGCRNAFFLLSSHIDGLEVAEVRRDVYTIAPTNSDLS